MASMNDFPMPNSVEMERETATDKYAKFVASPFQSGFGHTVGNALRRVLLSSLEGSAISAVRIDGTTHEFSSLPNVVEDVTEIILNLKKVKLKLHDDTIKTLEIKKNEAGPVTASDIINDGTVDIINPEQIICSTDAFFNGCGYSHLFVIAQAMSRLGLGNIPEMDEIWHRIESLRDEDGRVILGNSDTKKTVLMDAVGKPNKYLTLHVLLSEKFRKGIQ